jgi:hypothetical protein
MENLEKQIVRIIENNSPELAAEEILRLFSVVGRSEQLKCDCGETENIKKIAICACCYNPNTGEW